jgi:hypothetical protein
MQREGTTVGMELETWQTPPGDVIPNHPSYPVLIYTGTGVEDEDAARTLLDRRGWGGSWVSAGDVLVLPARDGPSRGRLPGDDPVGGDGIRHWTVG